MFFTSKLRQERSFQPITTARKNRMSKQVKTLGDRFKPISSKKKTELVAKAPKNELFGLN